MDNKEIKSKSQCDDNHEYENCGCGESDCDCGHDHEEVNKIYLTLEDDTELECYILDIIEIGVKQYIALLPENDERVLIYEYSESEDGVELLTIEDDEEFEIVSNTFKEIFEEYTEE